MLVFFFFIPGLERAMTYLTNPQSLADGRSLRSRRKHKAWGVSPRGQAYSGMRACGAGDSGSRLCACNGSVCRPLRGPIVLKLIRDPGVPLRSTPGFMLTPASQAWDCASNGGFVKHINALERPG